MGNIIIVANSFGWEPKRREVNRVLAKMKISGLRTDWTYCLVLKTRALVFLKHSDHKIIDSEVIYFHDKFMTKEEYYKEPLTKHEHKLAVECDD